MRILNRLIDGEFGYLLEPKLRELYQKLQKRHFSNQAAYIHYGTKCLNKLEAAF